MTPAGFRRAIGPALIVLAVGYPFAASAAPPVTPDAFRYEIYSESTAELFWSRSTNVPVQGYELTRNGDVLGVFDALSYVDGTLVPGTEYDYTIVAVGVDGDRSGLAGVSLVTPRSADTIASLRREVSSLERELLALESQIADGVRSPVPKTGQRISVLFGDDGDYQAGAAWPEPRFTVNVNEADDLDGSASCDGGETCNGAVTDNLTGLVWLRNANCFGARTWSDAVGDANGLAGDGSSGCGLDDGSQPGDWRLPNVKEIQSLMDYGHAFPTPLLPTDHPFFDVQTGGIDTRPASYWTSTSVGSVDGAYSVSMSVGWVERLSTTGDNFTWFVWPVRDRR